MQLVFTFLEINSAKIIVYDLGNLLSKYSIYIALNASNKLLQTLGTK